MTQALAKFRATRWLIVALVATLTACSDLKYDIYKATLDFERKRAGLEARTLDVNGMAISILDSGAAEGEARPTLVLLHGFGANKDNWVRLAGQLTDTYRVVAVDLPGHGDSVKDFNLSYDMDDQARYLHDTVAQLGLERFHLGGNSMGGAISALYAARYPEQVQSLVLFNPGGIHDFESELDRGLKDGINPLVLNSPEDIENQMAFAMAKPPFIPWPITAVLAEQSVANKPLHDRIYQQVRFAQDGYVFKDEIQKIKAPTLVLWGRADRVLDYRNADLFEQLIPGARKRVLDEIGHMPMLEAVEESARILREFVGAQKLG